MDSVYYDCPVISRVFHFNRPPVLALLVPSRILSSKMVAVVVCRRTLGGPAVAAETGTEGTSDSAVGWTGLAVVEVYCCNILDITHCKSPVMLVDR
jgi:hypothetical protein